MNTNAENDRSLGVFYQILGALSLFAGVALAGVHAWRGNNLTWYDALIILVLIIVCLALLRPNWLDNLIKTVLDRLPFFNYIKPPPPPIL